MRQLRAIQVPRIRPLRLYAAIALSTTTVLLAPRPSAATIIAFTNRDAWERAIGRPADFVETFDSFTADTSFRSTPLDLANISLTSVPPREGLQSFHNTVQVAPFPSYTPFTTPHVWLFTEGDSGLQVEMAFRQPVGAWGANFSDPNGEQAKVRIRLHDGSDVIMDVPEFPYYSGSRFFGVAGSEQEQIDSVTFFSVADGNFALGDSLKMDNVSGYWGTVSVPEPSSLLLLLAGIAVVGVRLRDQQ